MLGASHSNKYSLWRFGETATDGIKEIAEWGNTYKAESDMKVNLKAIIDCTSKIYLCDI